MAGIPMYYGIPTMGEVRAQMARDELDVLKTDKAQIEMDALKDKIELFKNMSKQQQPQQVAGTPPIIPSATAPVSYIPQQTQTPGNTAVQTMEVPTETPAPAAIPVPKTAADGTPMPSFMGGAKAEAEGKKVATPEAAPAATETEAKPDTVAGYQEPAKNVQAVPAITTQTQTQQEAPKTTIVDDLKSSSKQVRTDEQEMAFAYKFAEELRKRGNLLGWQEAIKNANDMKASVLDNQNKYLTVQDKFLDLTSGIAYGYTQAVKDNPNDQVTSDQSWANMLMMLQSKGIPVDRLLQITDPAKRMQVANQYMTSALGGKEQIRLTIADNQNKIREEANRIKEAHYKNQDSIKLQEQAFNQAKFNANNAQALIKASQSNINNLRNNITNYSNKEIRDQLRVQLDAAEKEHQELVKRLRLKANDEGIKWNPGSLVTANDLKPGATKKEEAPQASAEPTTETKSNEEVSSSKPSNIQFLPVETAKGYAAKVNHTYDPNYNYWVQDGNLMREAKSGSSSSSTTNTEDKDKQKEALRKEILNEVESLKKQQGAKAVLFGKPIGEAANDIKNYLKKDLETIDNPTIFGVKIQSSESAREERIKKLLDKLEELNKQ